MRENKSLAMFFVCMGYLIGGLLFIPATIAAFKSYNSGALNSDSLMQLGAIMLVLVAIPLILAYSLLEGYRFGWGLAILFASFNVVLYLITFSSLSITLSNGPLISDSVIGPLGYAIAYGIVYIATYIVVIIEILLNFSLIYFLTRKKTKEYFGL